ncbi:hypothetical protein M0802_009518 [Mischocyttarus mexicanus]|nr:hypothetical protein M0802_009518 [Mischocyttarus mexicanus]
MTLHGPQNVHFTQDIPNKRRRQLGRKMRLFQDLTLEDCSKDYDVAWTTKSTFYTMYKSSGPLNVALPL